MLTLLMLLLSVMCPVGSNAKKVLVLMDSPHVRDSHAQYFQALADQGYQLTFRMADDPSTQLSMYGELLYEHVIVFAPATVEFGGAASGDHIVNYVDQGGNLIVAAGPDVGYAVANVAHRCGFEFDAAGTAVIDHFNHNTAQQQQQEVDPLHTLVVADPYDHPNATVILGRDGVAPVLFRGVAMRVSDANPLTIPLIRARSTTFSGRPTGAVDTAINMSGRSVVLVGLLQARNNARVLFTGSLDMFSDELMAAAVATPDGRVKDGKSGNRDFVLALTQWTFQERNVLRVKSVKHHRVGETEPPGSYTIMDMLQFTIEIEQKVQGKWVPYVSDDVQLEFIRIDPFVRVTLKGNKDGVYTTTFQVPDVCGVYKLAVNYNRVGMTRLSSVTQVSVRPFQHTQYERFIRSAFPYYASALSMMVSLLLFSCVFLYHKDGGITAAEWVKKKKEQ